MSHLLAVVHAEVDTVNIPTINLVQDKRGTSGTEALVAVELLISVCSRPNPTVDLLTTSVGKDVRGKAHTASKSALASSVNLHKDLSYPLTFQRQSFPLNVTSVSDVDIVVRAGHISGRVALAVISHPTGDLIALPGVDQIDIFPSGDWLDSDQCGKEGGDLHGAGVDRSRRRQTEESESDGSFCDT
jgi:hypothetical protein